MTPSKPTSTGHSSSDSELTGSSTAQTPTNSAESILAELKSNPQSSRDVGSIKHLYKQLRLLKEIHQITFAAHIHILDLLHEAWSCGFNDRNTIK